MPKLVLLRHGESLWNNENRFTGWTDIDLSTKGIEEAKKAGLLLENKGFVFDAAYTSFLKRAIKTLYIVLDELGLMWIPVYKSWRLNERHYGALQGLNKSDSEKKYGKQQVLLWRRSYDIHPPAVEITDNRFPGNDRNYNTLKKNELPLCENLKDTLDRLLPYWNSNILPLLTQDKNILISAHGNSLRALVKHLDNISDENIIDLNIPTGIPLVYEMDKSLTTTKSYYLTD